MAWSDGKRKERCVVNSKYSTRVFIKDQGKKLADAGKRSRFVRRTDARSNEERDERRKPHRSLHLAAPLCAPLHLYL